MTASDGTDCTPKGIKERGLLALLLLSPGQRRTRSWLQDKLWSDRAPQRGAASFRRALSNMRRALGPLSERLGSDRSSLWISPPVPVDLAAGGGVDAELLEDLLIDDPEFEDWLRLLRQSQEPRSIVTRAPLERQPPTTLDIRYRGFDGGVNGRLMARLVGDRIGERLSALGEIELHVGDWEAERPGTERTPDSIIEIESLSDGDGVYILVRVFGAPRLRLLWSGRLRMPPTMAETWDNPEIIGLVNRAVTALIDRNATAATPSTYFTLQNAIRRIYASDRAALRSADQMLVAARAGETPALALAWHGFLRLTEALEFRSGSVHGTEEAVALASEALSLQPANPVVQALAAQIHMKLCGDFDYAFHLACKATEHGEDDPYALNAMSHARAFRGEYEESYRVARQAQIASGGLFNEFTWDMQCCLAALSVGHLDEATQFAADAHRKMPNYRPALRYLSALTLYAGKDASGYVEKLRRLEPDFTPDLLWKPDYPLDTFRFLGFSQALEDRYD